jgi:hypothetical protein
MEDEKKNTEVKIPEFISKLIEGYSTYNKVYIQFWTLIAIVSFITIIPTEEPIESFKTTEVVDSTRTAIVVIPSDRPEYTQTLTVNLNDLMALTGVQNVEGLPVVSRQKNLTPVIESGASEEVERLKLPFSLGEVAKVDFYPICFIFLSLLVICFGCAFAQTFRTAKLLYKAIGDEEDQIIFKNIYLQDVSDAMIYPSLTRVAPLANLVRRKYQFLPEKKNTPRWLHWLTLIYYLILKITTMLVMYLLPGFALWTAFIRGGLYIVGGFFFNLPFWIYIGLIASSGMVLTHLFIQDIGFILTVSRNWSKRSQEEPASTKQN